MDEMLRLLSVLEDRLITQHNFEKAVLVGGQHLDKSTQPLQLFITWVKSNPEVAQELRKLIKAF